MVLQEAENTWLTMFLMINNDIIMHCCFKKQIKVNVKWDFKHQLLWVKLFCESVLSHNFSTSIIKVSVGQQCDACVWITNCVSACTSRQTICSYHRCKHKLSLCSCFASVSHTVWVKGLVQMGKTVFQWILLNNARNSD